MPRFLITSLSNSSLKEYPHNTLTNFIHRLPSPIELTPGQPHSIALRTFAFTTNIKSLTNVGYIKVHLRELNPQFSAEEGDSQCLARVPITNLSKVEEDSTVDSFFYEFDHPVRVDLSEHTHLEQLSFFITDEKNKQLQIPSGVSTVVNMEIEDTISLGHFALTANPQYSIDVFVNNKNQDFRLLLPGPIQVDSNWEVALHSVIVPQSVDVSIRAELEFHNLEEDARVVAYIWEEVTGENVDELKEEMLSTFVLWDLVLQETNAGTAIIVDTAWREEPVTVVMNAACATILGIPTNGKDELSWDTDPNGLGVVVSDKPLTGGGLGCDHVMVYCDLVQDSIVGDKMCQLLDMVSSRSIGLFTQQTDTIFHLPHLSFRALGKHKFDNIHFTLATIDGRDVPLGESSESITLNLLFRQQRA